MRTQPTTNNHLNERGELYIIGALLLGFAFGRQAFLALNDTQNITSARNGITGIIFTMLTAGAGIGYQNRVYNPRAQNLPGLRDRARLISPSFFAIGTFAGYMGTHYSYQFAYQPQAK